MELGSGRRCGDRGIEESTALCDFGGALRHEPPPVCRRHPGVAPGRPHVGLADVEGPLGHKLASPRAVLREGGQFGEGECGAVRARLSKVLEVALERPAVGHLLVAGDSGLWHPRQHEQRLKLRASLSLTLSPSIATLISHTPIWGMGI